MNDQPTMTNMHRLQPCAMCPTRMAVPGSPVCTVCDAVTIPALIPATAEAVQEVQS